MKNSQNQPSDLHRLKSATGFDDDGCGGPSGVLLCPLLGNGSGFFAASVPSPQRWKEEEKLIRDTLLFRLGRIRPLKCTRRRDARWEQVER